MEESTPSLYTTIKNCSRWSRHATKQIKYLRKEGRYTVDIDQRLYSLANLFERINSEIFSLQGMMRIKLKRISPNMIESAQDICGDTKYGGLIYYNYDIKKALRYPDSLYIQSKNPDRFSHYENIINDIRGSINTVTEIRPLLNEYRKRYGVYKNILSDREFDWLQLALGFIGGLITGAVIPLVV